MKTPLEKELTALLNQHSRENESNTPDFLLADYLMRCLQTWEAVTRRRDEWYGLKLSPGKTKADREVEAKWRREYEEWREITSRERARRREIELGLRQKYI